MPVIEKSIQLNGITNGQVDENIKLYPKTKLELVEGLPAALNAKQDKNVTVVASSTKTIDSIDFPLPSVTQVANILTAIEAGKVVYLTDPDENDLYLIQASLLEGDADMGSISIEGRSYVVTYVVNLDGTGTVLVEYTNTIDTNGEIVMKSSTVGTPTTTIGGTGMEIEDTLGHTTSVGTESISIQEDDTEFNATTMTPTGIEVHKTNATGDATGFDINGAEKVHLVENNTTSAMKFVKMTQAAYDDITPDANTFYIIVG